MSKVFSRDYASWGRYPKAAPKSVLRVNWRHEFVDQQDASANLLPYGMGRSYGDSCLNNDGGLLDARPLKRFINFDPDKGVLRCEAGLPLSEILDFIVPRGWFLPVVPGTKFVTVGGAIANDIHGKNHHKAGTFGCHVTQLELSRSDGTRQVCSRTENQPLFKATVGGLGLTGLILWAEIQLIPISGSQICMESVKFGALDVFFDLADESDESFDYTVAWIDSLQRGEGFGRGLFMRGNHAKSSQKKAKNTASAGMSVPFDFPSFSLNSLTVRAFNALYYAKQHERKVKKEVHYNPFFFPLDGVRNWNRIYGSKGFLQYQCVIPRDKAKEGIAEILKAATQSRQGSFLSVIKLFGSIESPGLLSFPREGATLALDFPFKGKATLDLLNAFDAIVRQADGAVYPAKDARMSAADFKQYFPEWRQFMKYKDPNYNSNFWRRVVGNMEAKAK